ncbi:MAG TPA: 16S rRNA (cytidine(1402)-2'-O)-methyltransferase, partial [Pseudonocardiaceae bacterium]|nr:16S rRNA (cytidine(1402)-2'-O)-methyltransferase [Pseudonocardiaceae bacterium]
RRGGLAELAEWAAEGVRGEITVVLAGASPAPTTDMGELAEQVETLVAGGLRLKDAVAELATGTGISRKALYDAVLAGRTK